jgi:ABC-type transport system involved in multi-copper enzyme maturation permease subunit
VIPILHRELIGILRTRKAFALQFVMAVLFTGLIVLRWPSEARVDLSGIAAQQVFRLFAYGLLAAAILLVPIFPATSIVMERRRGTLALLLNSPLSPTTIYFGKLCGVIGFCLVLLATSLPAAGACHALGGVSFSKHLLALYGVLLVVATQYASLALLVSSFANTADSAVRMTYAAVLAISLGSLGPNFFLQGGEETSSLVAGWLACLSPVPVVLGILGHGDVGSVDPLLKENVLSRFLILAAATTLSFTGITIYRLSSGILDRARSSGIITDERQLGARVLRRMFFLIDPQRRKSTIGYFMNPILMKEFRSRRFGRSHWIMRLLAICAVASMLLAFSVTTSVVRWELETVGGPLVLLQGALLAVLMPSLAAGLISSECENGTWPLLRTSPLSPGTIVRGKLASAVWTMCLILCATLPGYLVMLYIQPTLWLQIARALVCLAFSGLLALMLSAAVGSLYQRTAAATTAAYIAVLLMFVGSMLVWLGRDAPFGHSVVEAALTINPIAAALAIFNMPGFRTYNLTPANWWFSGVAIVVLFVILRIRVWRLTRPE